MISSIQKKGTVSRQCGLDGNWINPPTENCVEINECNLEPSVCHSKAECLNTPDGSFTCTCPEGFTGNGRSFAMPLGNQFSQLSKKKKYNFKN